MYSQSMMHGQNNIKLLLSNLTVLPLKDRDGPKFYLKVQFAPRCKHILIF